MENCRSCLVLSGALEFMIIMVVTVLSRLPLAADTVCATFTLLPFGLRSVF